MVFASSLRAKYQPNGRSGLLRSSYFSVLGPWAAQKARPSWSMWSSASQRTHGLWNGWPGSSPGPAGQTQWATASRLLRIGGQLPSQVHWQGCGSPSSTMAILASNVSARPSLYASGQEPQWWPLATLALGVASLAGLEKRRTSSESHCMEEPNDAPLS